MVRTVNLLKQNVMSRIKRFICSLALIFALAFGFAPGANAQTVYTCNESGNPPPASVSGDADLTESGSCTLDYTVNATGEISINAGSNIDIVGLTAGNGVTIDGSGDLSAGDDIMTSSGAVSISANSIDIEGVTASSEIDITSEADMTLGDDVSANNGPLTIEAGTTADTQGLYAGGDLNVDTNSTFNSTDIVTYAGSSGNIYLYPGDTTMIDGNVQADNSTTIQPDDANVTITGFVEGYTGFVDIEAQDIEIDENIESAQYVSVIADDDSIEIDGYISANTADGGGNVLLQAQNDIQTGTIYGSSDTTATAVEIDANLAGGNSLFTIGGDGESNGVNGSIFAGNNTGGGTAVDSISGGVFITNGTSDSTGGITVVDGSDIQVNSTAARSGFIILQAQSGVITISSDTLSSDGDNGAGDIELMADTVVFGDSVTASVSQPVGVFGNDHPIVISANTLSFGSDVALHADGDGASSDLAGFVNIVPFGAHTRTSNYDVEDLEWDYTDTIVNTPITISGSSDLTVTANGAYDSVGIFGDGTTFSGTDLTITANGTSTQINVYAEGTDVRGDIAFANTGNVFISANGVGGDGGNVLLYGDAFTISSAIGFTVEANGPSTGDGDGGTVQLDANSSTFGASLTGYLSADAASGGTGNGGSVEWFPGMANVSLGTNAGDFALSANGGSTNGDAGSIEVNPDPGNITFDTDGALSTTVLGTNGNGGTVTLNATGVTQNADSTINVDGQGTGNGGNITIWATSDINIAGDDDGTPALKSKFVKPRQTVAAFKPSFKSGTNGNGGNLDLGYGVNTTISGGTIAGYATQATPGSNGNGGTINVHDITGTVTVSATLNVSGSGTGDGGTITINSSSTGTMTLDDSTMIASADPNGTGNGGQITIHNGGDISVNTTNILAQGGGATTGNTGNGGSVSITDDLPLSGGTLIDIDTLVIKVNAGSASTGNGGSVVMAPEGPFSAAQRDVVGNIYVDGGTGTNDGSIQFNGITCNQVKTTFFPTFPKSYWSCLTSANDLAPIPTTVLSNIPGTLKSLLGIVVDGRAQAGLARTQVFVFPDANALATFSQNNAAVPGLAGLTWETATGGETTRIYVNLMTTNSIQTMDASNMGEVSAHEFGHAVDIAKSQSMQSQSTNYAKALLNDLLYLDYASGDPSGTRTLPCSTTNTAPFDNIENNSGQSICGTGDGYTSIPGSGTGILNAYVVDGTVMSNSRILQTATPALIFISASPANSQLEVYAQVFSFEDFVSSSTQNPSNEYILETFDALLAKTSDSTPSYFGCTQAWALNLLGRSSSPPSYCGSTVSGYTPYQ